MGKIGTFKLLYLLPSLILLISNNVEFTTYVISNSLSDIWFKLVDANFHSIKLLSPIYISAIGKGIDSHFGSFVINIPQKETINDTSQSI